jgi:hypothetical protein
MVRRHVLAGCQHGTEACIFRMNPQSTAKRQYCILKGLAKNSAWPQCDPHSGRSDVQLLGQLREGGNPNGQDLPAWPAFANPDNKVLYIGDPITVGSLQLLSRLADPQ